MEQRMTFTARASSDSEGSPTAVGVSNRIGNRHEPKIFDNVSGEQAERRRIGKGRYGVEEIRD
jgi:hypothetical protein